MKKRQQGLYWVVGIAALAGIFILFRGPEAHKNVNQITQSLGLSQVFSSGSSADPVNSGGFGQSANTPAVQSDSAAEVSPQFRQWLTKEAMNLESSVQDPKVKEAALKERAQSFTAIEVLHLKNQALAQDNTANDRILSTYLLTLSSAQSTKALSEIVQQPLSYPPVTEVHSVQENMAMQERSLRRMAIDSLIERAQSDQELREELPKNIAQIPDTNLREYAQKSYHRAFDRK